MFWVTAYLVINAFAGLQGALGQDYPNVTLPWGTYRASSFDQKGDFYTFRNVRFGKAPVGVLRFQKSVFPDSIADPSELQPDEGASCHSVTPSACDKQVAHSNLAATAAGPPSLIPGLPRSPAGEASEDCLFADLYVPASALVGKVKVPIVVWIYGGAFIFGAKDAGLGENNMPFYNGTGLLRTAHAQNQDFIFITGNYRLGAFGWLAGPTMEQFGSPNAGLWDQRLLLDFAQQYLPLFGGNASDIGVWGESAGGGSILHHLTSTEPPVFSRALIQSPAYLWQWDRTEGGHAASIFKNMTDLAVCPSTGVEAFNCLQNLSDTTLQEFNKEVIEYEICNTGLIPFNPAVDGSLITQLPTTSFQQGFVWKNITSLVVSHVADESASFVPHYINDNNTFQRFLNNFLPGPDYISQRQSINNQYGQISDFKQRAHDVIADSSFLCNTRFVYDAYNPASAVYMMQYDFGRIFKAARHASDLIPTFLNTDIPEHDFYLFIHNHVDSSLLPLFVKILFNFERKLSKEYQPYLASFGATGTPKPAGGSPFWNVAKAGDQLSHVMQVFWELNPRKTDFRNNTTDSQNNKTICDFWGGIANSLEVVIRNREQPTDGRQKVFQLEL